jgi:hypothetical protein
LLRKTERNVEAEELEARGKPIRARHAEKNPSHRIRPYRDDYHDQRGGLSRRPQKANT